MFRQMEEPVLDVDIEFQYQFIAWKMMWSDQFRIWVSLVHEHLCTYTEYVFSERNILRENHMSV